MANSDDVLNQVVLNYLTERKRKQKWRWVTRSFVMLLIEPKSMDNPPKS